MNWISRVAVLSRVIRCEPVVTHFLDGTGCPVRRRTLEREALTSTLLVFDIILADSARDVHVSITVRTVVYEFVLRAEAERIHYCRVEVGTGVEDVPVENSVLRATRVVLPELRTPFSLLKLCYRMNRRALIRLLVGGGITATCGCLNRTDLSPRSNQTVREGLQRRVSVIGRDSVPDKYQFRIKAELLRSTITGSQTAKIRITTINGESEKQLSISAENCALFNRKSQGSLPEGLWLRPVGERIDSSDEKSKWIARNLPESPGGFGGYGCPQRSFDKGESIHTDYIILHDGRVNGYLEPGQYRFEEEVEMTEKDSKNRDTATSTSLTWGFSLEITHPDE